MPRALAGSAEARGDAAARSSSGRRAHLCQNRTALSACFALPSRAARFRTLSTYAKKPGPWRERPALECQRSARPPRARASFACEYLRSRRERTRVPSESSCRYIWLKSTCVPTTSRT
eukprot:Transcript_4966.p4 GENE.Transcript_4966~~Transcript_4966.p4  ORF type:complete len:118 (-),score=4.61 Transcript_4966:151-504(-)